MLDKDLIYNFLTRHVRNSLELVELLAQIMKLKQGKSKQCFTISQDIFMCVEKEKNDIIIFSDDKSILEAVENDYEFKILNSVLEVNSDQRTKLYDKIEAYFQGDLNGKTIGVWGLAFKPNTDDIREAPALYNIDLLLEKGARVIVFDPEASENVKKIANKSSLLNELL